MRRPGQSRAAAGAAGARNLTRLDGSKAWPTTSQGKHRRVPRQNTIRVLAEVSNQHPEAAPRPLHRPRVPEVKPGGPGVGVLGRYLSRQLAWFPRDNFKIPAGTVPCLIPVPLFVSWAELLRSGSSLLEQFRPNHRVRAQVQWREEPKVRPRAWHRADAPPQLAGTGQVLHTLPGIVCKFKVLGQRTEQDSWADSWFVSGRTWTRVVYCGQFEVPSGTLYVQVPMVHAIGLLNLTEPSPESRGITGGVGHRATRRVRGSSCR